MPLKSVTLEKLEKMQKDVSNITACVMSCNTLLWPFSSGVNHKMQSLSVFRLMWKCILAKMVCDCDIVVLGDCIKSKHDIVI